MSKTFNISPLIFLLAGCGLSSEVPPVEPPLGPPMAAGTICVDVVQAASMVSVSKPGFQTETQEVWLLTAEPIELKLELQPVMRSI
ncbi:MAG: hypothetical protein ACI9VR_003536 [Cognaticolwellia sp.]|jgi:hypothetical protein